ncbi:hypothetical protein ACHAWC_002502 [Mediolabrus comicus]
MLTIMVPWLLLLILCLKSCDSFCINVAVATRHHHRDLCSLNAASAGYNEQDDRSLVNTAIDDFISTVLVSLHDKTFDSFTLKASTPRKKRGGNKNKSSTNTEEIDTNIERQKEALRGKYKTILGRLVFLQDKKKRRTKKKGSGNDNAAAELDSGSLYLQVTIKYHLATDIVQNWGIESDVSEVESGLRGIFATAWGNNDSAVPLSEWGATTNVKGEIDIRAGELITSDGVYELHLHGKNAKFREPKKNKNKERRQSQLMIDPTQLSHDRTKKVPLSNSEEFFQKLGVTNSDGKPMSGMASKLRQCQKFVEIVSNLVDTNCYSSSNSKAKSIRVIDMGCGRGYLTFSLHSYLSDKYNDDSSSSCIVETQGIEVRPKLVREINGIARDLGKGKFEKLSFIEGTIGETNDSLFGDVRLHQNVKSKDSLDIVIALHACDTATDDALWFAIGRGVDVIVTAPCCQHELRPQIDQHVSKNPNHILADVLRHAIYRERATEQITDSIRAILLEIAGYDVQVFEFIGGQHTAKNVMITATKKNMSMKSKKEDDWLDERRGRLVELTEMYGVKRQRLASLMGERISTSGHLKAKNAGGMPPL